jgi:uncharacterized 2Fe-2S/4Fe-4S cluster protein (DUF4445 family)
MTHTMPEKKNLIVDMLPVGRRVDISEGSTMLEAAQSAGVGLLSL